MWTFFFIESYAALSFKCVVASSSSTKKECTQFIAATSYSSSYDLCNIWWWWWWSVGARSAEFAFIANDGIDMGFVRLGRGVVDSGDDGGRW